MRKGVWHTGQLLFDQSTHRCLIRRVDRRPQEANRHCLYPTPTQTFQYLARLAAIERDHDLTLRVDPLMNLECQSTWDIRLWIAGREVVGIGLAALTKHQYFGKP